MSCLLCFAMLAVAPAAPAAADTPTNTAHNAQKIMDFMNRERAARGMSALSRDSRLDSLAQSWSNRMVAEHDMYHPGTPQAIRSASYRSGGQNLAWHDQTLTAGWAHNFWMNSSPHRKNIVDPAYTHAGVAFACIEHEPYDYVFVTVEFGGNAAPLTSTPPKDPHVAGSGSGSGVSCNTGSDEPDPAPEPPPPPPPAPAAAPAAPPAAPASPDAKPKPGPDPPSPSPPKNDRSAPGSNPEGADPPAPLAGIGTTATPGPEPSPAPATEPVSEPEPTNLTDLEAASAGGEAGGAGPILAIAVALAGLWTIHRLRGRAASAPGPRHRAPRRRR